jgi:hypothetical protein
VAVVVLRLTAVRVPAVDIHVGRRPVVPVGPVAAALGQVLAAPDPTVMAPAEPDRTVLVLVVTAPALTMPVLGSARPTVAGVVQLPVRAVRRAIVRDRTALRTAIGVVLERVGSPVVVMSAAKVPTLEAGRAVSSVVETAAIALAARAADRIPVPVGGARASLGQRTMTARAIPVAGPAVQPLDAV